MKLKRYIALIVPLSIMLPAHAQAQGFLPGIFSRGAPEEIETAPLAPPPRKASTLKAQVERVEPRKPKPAPVQLQAAKPKKVVAVSIATPMPLPVPRPWGNKDAPDDEALAAEAPPSAEPLRETAQEPAPHSMPHLMLIAGPGIERASDLKGRRVAIRPSAEPIPEQVEKDLDVHAVAVEWPKSLERLATGDVDAVLVAVGPASLQGRSENFVEPYRLIEIPLAEEATVSRDR